MSAALRSRARRALDRLRTTPEERAHIEALRASGLFDAGYYLRQYPDVAGTGRDPLLHYVRLGWREGRSPHPVFDPSFYRAANPGLAGADPFAQFIA